MVALQACCWGHRSAITRFCPNPRPARIRDRFSKFWHHVSYRLKLSDSRLYRYIQGLATIGRSTGKLKNAENVDPRRHNLRQYKAMCDRYELEPYPGKVLLAYAAGHRRRRWSEYLTGEVEGHRIYGLHEQLTKKSHYYKQWIRHLAKRLDVSDQESVG